MATTDAIMKITQFLSRETKDKYSGVSNTQHNWNCISCNHDSDGRSKVTLMILWSGEDTKTVFAFCLVGVFPSTMYLWIAIEIMSRLLCAITAADNTL